MYFFYARTSAFFFRLTTVTEIKALIKNVKITSPGCDNVSIKVVKECSHEIYPFLVNIINYSFKEGCFPKHLQIAKVTPIL